MPVISQRRTTEPASFSCTVNTASRSDWALPSMYSSRPDRLSLTEHRAGEMPVIDGDTLRGSDLGEAVAIPLKNIRSVRAKAPAPDRTTLLVAAVVAAGLYVSKRGGFPSGSYSYVPDGDCHCVGDVVAGRE